MAPGGLAPGLDAFRLGLHVVAASVWVGGQIVLAGLVPAARRIGAGAPRALADAFARLSWPAYGVVVGTGIWNVTTFTLSHQASAWQVVLWVKVALVVAAGAGALLHSRARSRTALAAWGAVSALASVAALFMGVLLAGP